MVTVGAIQASALLEKEDINKINNKQVDINLINKLKQQNLKKYTEFIEKAAQQKINILGLPEVFAGPFFPAISNDPNWHHFAEPDSGPTIQLMQQLANKYNMVIIVPFYEIDNTTYYNTCAVIDANGDFLGKYRKLHVPNGDGFSEQDYFATGNLGLPVFSTQFGKVGVYICFDRHFIDGFRQLKQHGAQIVFVPSATVAATSQYIWEAEARIRAYDNKYFVVAINRVGKEHLGGLADTHFYGLTSIIDPRGKVLAQGSETDDEIVLAEVNFEKSITYATERYPLWNHIVSPQDYEKIPAPKKRSFNQTQFPQGNDPIP